MATPLSRRRESPLELGAIARSIEDNVLSIRGEKRQTAGGTSDKEGGGKRKSGGESESPTGGPSQTPDRKPLDRDPTEEGSAGKSH
jgi:hypothetical protein